MLEQGLQLQSLPKIAPEALPLPLHKPVTLLKEIPEENKHTFPVQPNTAGHSTKVRRKIVLPDEPPAHVPIEPSPKVTVIPQVRISDAPLLHTPYSTKHYRKRKLEQEHAGMFKRAYTRTATVKLCRRCGQDKASGGHRQYYGNIYCPTSCDKSYEEWLEQFSGKYKK